MFHKIVSFYGKVMLAPRPTPKLEYHLLPAVRYYLLSIFADSCIRKLTARHAVLRGTQVSWQRTLINKIMIYQLVITSSSGNIEMFVVMKVTAAMTAV